MPAIHTGVMAPTSGGCPPATSVLILATASGSATMSTLRFGLAVWNEVRMRSYAPMRASVELSTSQVSVPRSGGTTAVAPAPRSVAPEAPEAPDEPDGGAAPHAAA